MPIVNNMKMEKPDNVKIDELKILCDLKAFALIWRINGLYDKDYELVSKATTLLNLVNEKLDLGETPLVCKPNPDFVFENGLSICSIYNEIWEGWYKINDELEDAGIDLWLYYYKEQWLAAKEIYMMLAERVQFLNELE